MFNLRSSRLKNVLDDYHLPATLIDIEQVVCGGVIVGHAKHSFF